MVRPEKLRITGQGEAATGDPKVDGQVESSVFLGTATQIVVKLAGGVRMTVLVPNADEAERSRLPGGGADVRLSWAPEHIHVVRESELDPVPRLYRRRPPGGRMNKHALPPQTSPGGFVPRFGFLAARSRCSPQWPFRRAASRPLRRGRGSTAGPEGTASGELAISNWPFYIDKDTVDGPRVRGGGDRDQRRLHRGRQRQQRVLRQGPAAARERRVGRPRHLRRHRLDGRRRCTTSATSRTSTRSAIPNVEENLSRPREPGFDPERDFSVPWQSGMTGLVVNTDEAPDITSINDLFDPKYKGKVEVLTEMRDTVPLVMKADGVDPATPRPRTGWPRSTRSARPPTPARSATSPATTTPPTSPAATSSR